MTDDRDICERLECPSYDGAIYMRQDAAKEIRALREYSSKQALDIVALGQEVGRLREALSNIVEAWDWWQVDTYDRCQSVLSDAINEARAALAEQKSTQEK